MGGEAGPAPVSGDRSAEAIGYCESHLSAREHQHYRPTVNQASARCDARTGPRQGVEPLHPKDPFQLPPYHASTRHYGTSRKVTHGAPQWPFATT
jgi:hypothetical protein